MRTDRNSCAGCPSLSTYNRVTDRRDAFDPKSGFVCSRKFSPHVRLGGKGDGVAEFEPRPTCPTSKLVPVADQAL